MAKKKTHEEYVEELKIKNPDIEVVGEYMGAKTPILHHCLKHDIYWNTYPLNVLKGHGCIECRKAMIHKKNGRKHNEYVEELIKINPYIIVLGEYINAKTPILHYCTIHDVEWNACPDSILHGCGCPECGKEKIGDRLRKSHDQYVNDVRNKNKNIIVVGRYIDSQTPILHKCLKDGYEWMAKPTNILSGFGCPKCSESKGEKKVGQWLYAHNIVYDYQKCFDDCIDIKPLSFDFYLPMYNVCIEYQGRQHYEPVEHFGGEEQFKVQQRHDQIKRDYCRKNNINLLEIPYYKDAEEKLNNFLFI